MHSSDDVKYMKLHLSMLNRLGHPIKTDPQKKKEKLGPVMSRRALAIAATFQYEVTATAAEL